MPIPKPKVPLKDHCSEIYDGKLYTYQEDAFQSLDLKEGGEWTQLDMGVPTQGSVCVQGNFDDQASFIVVGGTTDKNGYSGLQHYSFKDSKWISDKPADTVTTNRRRHGAAFIQQSSEILTYGGSQDDDHTATSQTFLISTKQPYVTRAFNSQAPPVVDPLLLSYNSTHALMLGGDPTNTKLFTFSPETMWNLLDIYLKEGLKDASKTQATVMTGSDGSKVLELFDMSSSPNKITSILVQNATQSSKRKRSNPHHPTKRRKREIALSDRPTYNSTLAPQDARSGFSVASDDKTGLVVASGGNDQAPLAMFNDTGNQWLDPNMFFGNEPQPTPTPLPSSTTSDLPSSTSSTSPPATSSAAAHKNNSSRDKSLTILGGVLGGVLGAAVVLILLLILLRYWKKRRALQQEQQRQSEYKLDEKGEMDFMDMGADFMREAGGSAAVSPGFTSPHGRNESEGSTKQKERGGAASSLSKRALLHAKGDSTGSQRSFWSRGSRSPDPPPQISAPIMGPSLSRSMASPEIRNDTGWSRYFAETPAQEGFARSAPRVDDPRQNSFLSTAQTHSTNTSSALHSSAEIEPLNFRPSQNYLPSGLGVALSHSVSRDATSNKSPTPSIVSDIEEESEYHHSNGQDSWSPVESGSGRERNSGWTDERTISSTHTNSAPYPHPGEHVHIPNFPMPTSGRSSAVASIASPVSPQGGQPPQLPTHSPGLRNVVSRDLIRSNSHRQQAEGLVRTGTQRVTPSNSPFPRPDEQQWGITRESNGSQNEDMSWLNLGTSVEQHSNYHTTR
ncbi:uncharacterized protein KY384_002006 [Bacidia gigantensis]|uniref:uncharacterized protein n=1 Tax=Bacidia gigantensis TaxID=2732470 RepID=UPI001D04D9D4|nr:uncharacterized protein KY384_002006 [Bacidia gigantensis]KAG8533223.1 hypothetical protein KY384_002006 [Bacidia gigantensis]